MINYYLYEGKTHKFNLNKKHIEYHITIVMNISHFYEKYFLYYIK